MTIFWGRFDSPTVWKAFTLGLGGVVRTKEEIEADRSICASEG